MAASLVRVVPMAEVRRAYYARNPEGHWFDPGSMRFFASRLPRTGLVLGRLFYFVSSEEFRSAAGNSLRRYTIRVLGETGIDEVGEFQQYPTSAAANAVLRKILMTKCEVFAAQAGGFRKDVLPILRRVQKDGRLGVALDARLSKTERNRGLSDDEIGLVDALATRIERLVPRGEPGDLTIECPLQGVLEVMAAAKTFTCVTVYKSNDPEDHGDRLEFKRTHVRKAQSASQALKAELAQARRRLTEGLAEDGWYIDSVKVKDRR